MNINIHIERLILNEIDLPRHQRPRLQAALEAELSRLLSENGVPTHLQMGGAIPSLSANMTVGKNLNPTRLGQQIAKSIYEGLSTTNRF